MAYENEGRDRYRDQNRGDWRSRDNDPRERGGASHQRGFFDRASDEVSSWFGDEDAERRREQDGRQNRSYGQRSEQDRFERSSSSDNYRDPDQWPAHAGGYAGNPRDEGGERTWRGEQRDQDRAGWFGQRDDNRDRGGRRYGPPQNYGRGDSDRSSDRGRWGGRDETNRGVGTGSRLATSGGRDYGDPHYHEWRQRQIDELDRDYDEYRRENQSRFSNEFSSWRMQRQSKRSLMSQVREHMDVVGSDDQKIGTVDHVRGDRIILAKNDPEAGGVHRSLGCDLIDRVDNDRLVLNRAANEARGQLQREETNASAPGSPAQSEPRSDGPHALERSFSGTYR